ncbi:MAG: hypothetical protein M3071_18435 [Actinomycetota bacterium]|nr:hypothetical protein [Actinomycetota bacterium]
MAVVKLNAIEVAPERVESASGQGGISVHADPPGGFARTKSAGAAPVAQGSSLREFEVVQEVVTARTGT